MVTKLYYPRIGGVETLVRTILENFVKMGHEVTVLAMDPEYSSDEIVQGVHVIRFKRGIWGRSGLHPRLWNYLIDAEVKKNFDIVHIHNYHTLFAFQAGFFCHSHKIPFVFTTHYHGKGHTPLRDALFRSYRTMGRYLFQWSERVVCVSEYEKALVKRDFEMPEDKISIIPNGGKEYPLLNVPRRKSSVLYVGRVVDYKGLDHALQALAILKHEETTARLRIVGDGPDKQRLIGIINELGLVNDVDWVGGLTEEQLNAEYRSATVLVLLSSAEAYGLVVAEALMCGTPCIVTKAAALTEFTHEPGCFGVDYPINDAKLAEMLKYVLDNFASIKVGPFSEKMISWSKVTDLYLDQYHMAIENKR